MTVQSTDTVIFRGKTWKMRTCPLGPFLKRHRPEVQFERQRTDMFQGYTAHWEFSESRLYLQRIIGEIRDADGRDALEYLFPNQPRPIFASWYSGRLYIPCGAPMKVKYSPYGYETDDHMEVIVRRGIFRGLDEGLGKTTGFDRIPWLYWARHFLGIRSASR